MTVKPEKLGKVTLPPVISMNYQDWLIFKEFSILSQRSRCPQKLRFVHSIDPSLKLIPR